MAAPHVAGVIALMLQKNKTLTPAQVRDILKANTAPVAGPATEWGAGKLDAKRAWEAVPAPSAAPPASPSASPSALAARASIDRHQALLLRMLEAPLAARLAAT